MGGSSHGLLERTSTHECVERDYELRLSQREAEAFLTLAIQILLADLLATSAILRHQFQGDDYIRAGKLSRPTNRRWETRARLTASQVVFL